MSEKLLPCPFCGEEPTISKGRPFVVHCDMCGCETSTFNNAELASKRWNTRSGDAPAASPCGNPIEYEVDAKGSIQLPSGAPFDGNPVLIKLAAGWCEAYWEGARVGQNQDGTTYDGFCWVYMDGEGMADLDDVKLWASLPDDAPPARSAATSDTARQLGMTDAELSRETAMAAFMSEPFPEPKCDRCGSVGDTYQLCAGCGAPVPSPEPDAVRGLPAWQQIQIGLLMGKLRDWREADHEDAITICRSDIIALIDGFAALSRPAHGGWQDISTAPTDGTWILVWEDYGTNNKFSPADVARYDLGYWQNGEKSRVHHATHWMPLPGRPLARNDRVTSQPDTDGDVLWASSDHDEFIEVVEVLGLQESEKTPAQAVRDLYAAMDDDANSIEKLTTALRNLVNETVNPGDGGPYEDGEWPALDAARRTLGILTFAETQAACPHCGKKERHDGACGVW